MPLRDWKFRIQDILDAVRAVREYTQGMEFKTFIEDRRTVDAVVRNLIIIGEAAIQVPEEICLKYPEVPWYDMKREKGSSLLLTLKNPIGYCFYPIF